MVEKLKNQNQNSPYGFRSLSEQEIDECLNKVKTLKLHINTIDNLYACFYNMRDLSMVGSFNELGSEFFDICNKAKIDLESYRRKEIKSERSASYDALVMNEVFKLIEANETDKSKRVKGLKKNVLYKTVEKILPDVDKRHIHKSIKKHIKVGALVYETQSKSSKLIRKGNYYSSYVKSYK